jgi:hypothetical protein
MYVSVGDESGPVATIQAQSSPEAFQTHAAWMGPQVPRRAALLATSPNPPVLLEQISLQGHGRERFGVV